ncbi:MAG: GAF domain-containing sensor histidine kinase [Vitreimonas sp.]
MPDSIDPYAKDVAAIASIAAVPTMLDIVCRITGMGFAAVARVSEDRWIACSVKDDIAFGLTPGGELVVESTICHEIRQSREAVVIDDVACDAQWSTHHTPQQYGFRSYISMPIVLADGTFFGTLCAIDPKPAALNRVEVVGMFRSFAELIAFHLDAQTRLAEEQLLSRRRDQFIAVLGHDLRNPVASISAGASSLARLKLDPKAASVVALIQGSAVRMAGLVDNVLDFARGRLGGGLTVHRKPTALEPVLRHVVDELRVLAGERRIEARFAVPREVNVDGARVGQLFSNLLANALAHGAPGTPVAVSAEMTARGFELSVANAGAAIAPEVMARLFQPFFRGENRHNAEGLGLGLYIASEIAQAHRGELLASSTAEGTQFTFVVPDA